MRTSGVTATEDAQAHAEWEYAELDGGPASGLRLRVSDRPKAIQVTLPCELVDPVDPTTPAGLRVEALYIYRRDLRVKTEPLRYGFDGVSP
ncbi:hypothetical protein OK074_4309 [Actinobacteria bacterium OK074]|nr:hypothetical protein OK074_4309 [Actinobacteria bacterium OK074]